MVKKILILYIILINTSFLYSQEVRMKDTIRCDKYFKYLNSHTGDEIIDLWSQPPLLKEKNASILSGLCDTLEMMGMIDNIDKKLSVTLILDENGNPICTKIYPEIKNDSLRNKIMSLLYMIEFEPAIGHKKTVISHYVLILNTRKCKTYKEILIKSEKKEKI